MKLKQELNNIFIEEVKVEEHILAKETSKEEKMNIPVNVIENNVFSGKQENDLNLCTDPLQETHSKTDNAINLISDDEDGKCNSIQLKCRKPRKGNARWKSLKRRFHTMPWSAVGTAGLRRPIVWERDRWQPPPNPRFANENRSRQRRPIRGVSGDVPTTDISRRQLSVRTATCSAMEWTNNKVFELINLYRERPILWDCRMKEYKDRNKKLDALTEIAESLGVDKDEADRKIKNLVCHFLSEVKKERDSIKSGAGSDGVYKSKWFCYNNMLFLKDRNQPRGITDTITQEHNTTLNGDVIEQETQNVAQDQVASKNSTERVMPRSRKKQKTSGTEEALSIIRGIEGQSVLETDQYKAFGDQVGLRIRDLPSSNAKNVVKYLISNILFEAEMGKYDNPTSVSYPQHFPVQQQVSVHETPSQSNLQHFEQPTDSGSLPTISNQSVISLTPSVYSISDSDSN